MKNVELIDGYESPQIEIIEVEMEKGFAASDLEAGGEDAHWEI